MQIEFIIKNRVQIFNKDNQEYLFGEIKTILSIDSVNNKLISTENLAGRYIKTISDNLNNPDSFVGVLEDASDPNYYPYYEFDLSFTHHACDPAYIKFLFPEKYLNKLYLVDESNLQKLIIGGFYANICLERNRS